MKLFSLILLLKVQGTLLEAEGNLADANFIRFLSELDLPDQF